MRPGHGRTFAQRGARNSSEHRAFAADLYPADLCRLQDLEEARSREEEAHGSQPPCLAGAVLYSVLKPRPVERRCNPPFCGGSMWGRSRVLGSYTAYLPLDLRARARSPGLPGRAEAPGSPRPGSRSVSGRRDKSDSRTTRRRTTLNRGYGIPALRPALGGLRALRNCAAPPARVAGPPRRAGQTERRGWTGGGVTLFGRVSTKY